MTRGSPWNLSAVEVFLAGFRDVENIPHLWLVPTAIEFTQAMPILYTTGDATSPLGDGPKIIVHCCNDIGRWGKGFVMALSKRWKEPEESYRAWHAEPGDTPFELGQVQFVEVEDELFVANMIGQHGIRRSGSKPPIRYDAIEQGLKRVADFASERKASVHMPRIGCGLAGGKWEKIEPLIKRTLVAADVEVTVYDFEPTTR
jgi:O-acetyl-ADP-ribose deacetylase (regulator of RNase III)